MNDAEQRHNFSGGEGQSGHIGDELLSAYLDDPESLSSAEYRRIERHVAGCTRCQRALAELGIIVQALRTLPPFDVPRTFHLTPDMVQAPARPPVVLQESAPFYMRHMGTIRGAAAFAAVIFVFVLAADILTNAVTGQSDADDASPVTSALERSSAAEEDAATDESAGAAADSAATVSPAAGVAEEEEAEEADEAEDAEPESQAEPAATPVDEDDDTSGGESQQAVPPATAGDDASEADADESATSDTALVEEPDREAATQAQPSGDDTRRYFRFAEVTLVIIFTLLLALIVILPRWERSRHS